MPKTDLGLALLLAGLTTLSRVPFRARLLPSWDAIQFALALREYDVVKHQPHPPGYILYVVLARGLDALLGDPTAALTWLAVAASGITVFLVYRLAWMLYDRPTAVVAAVGLAASPLFWYYGLLGLPYATEAALVTAVAALTWPVRAGRASFAGWSALALALGGGLRQSLLVLLCPLWLGIVWAGLRRWRPVLSGLAVIAAVSAAWFVPMVLLTGGLGRYVGAALELFDSTVRATTLAGEWRINAVGLAEALVLGLGLLLPALAWRVARGVARPRPWGARAWFFAAWIVPPLVVYIAVHFGQPGYLLAVLPALHILAARGLVGAGGRLAAAWRRPAWRGALVASALAGITLAHTAFFALSGPIDVRDVLAARPETHSLAMALRGRYRFRLWPHTAGGLREQEQVIAAYVEGIRRGFDPAETLLVTELGNPRSYPWFRHVMYYLPEYATYHLRLGGYSPGYLSSRQAEAMATLRGSEILLPPHARRLVWVVDYWNPQIRRPPGLVERPLPHGRWLYVLDLGRRTVEHAGYRLTPLAAVARLR